VLLEPLSAGGKPCQSVGPYDVMGVRVVHREQGRTLPVTIVSANAPISPDGTQVFVHPQPDRATDVALFYTVAGDDGTRHHTRKRFDIAVVPDEPGPLPDRLQINQLAIQSPSILPTFDQIGLASLAIDIALLSVAGDQVLAWGTQRFGLEHDGTPVGVPQPRVHHYPLDGTWHRGTLILEAHDVLFEITAFPVPLDRIRCVLHHREGRLGGGTLMIETDVSHILSRAPYPSLYDTLDWVRSWFPGLSTTRELNSAVQIARNMVPVFTAIAGGMYRPWGLVDPSLRFHGIGVFKTAHVPEVSSDLTLSQLAIEQDAIVARWRGGRAWDAPAMGLIRDGAWVTLPIALRLRTDRDGAGRPTLTQLSLWNEAWDEAVVIHDGRIVARLPSQALVRAQALTG
ncbi:MAG: hypothetical protein AAFX99_28030, partial [Myxococcota bacterium]